MKNLVKLFAFVIFLMFVCNGTPSNAWPFSKPCTIKSVKACHILVDTKEQADMIKAKLDSGECFETIAKKYSKCPSKDVGGDLGYFEKGQMVKEFEDAAFELPVGKISEPVKTQFGWHIIKVCDKK